MRVGKDSEGNYWELDEGGKPVRQVDENELSNASNPTQTAPTIREKGVKDEILQLFEKGSTVTDPIQSLRTLNTALTKMTKEEIEQLVDDTILDIDLFEYGERLAGGINPDEISKMHSEVRNAFINLRRVEDGFFAELVLKSHAVQKIIQNNEMDYPTKPKKQGIMSFLNRM